MPPSHSDVIVIGGGPAGSTAARLLAEWGHSVTVIAKPDGRPNLGQYELVRTVTLDADMMSSLLLPGDGA